MFSSPKAKKHLQIYLSVGECIHKLESAMYKYCMTQMPFMRTWAHVRNPRVNSIQIERQQYKTK